MAMVRLRVLRGCTVDLDGQLPRPALRWSIGVTAVVRVHGAPVIDERTGSTSDLWAYAAYGHFGRSDEDFIWRRTDRVAAPHTAAPGAAAIALIAAHVHHVHKGRVCGRLVSHTEVVVKDLGKVVAGGRHGCAGG